MANIDELSVKISAQTKNVGSGIDKLITKLTALSKTLGSVDTKGMQKFASGLQMMSTGMQGLSNVSLPDYTRTAKGINALSQIDGSKLASVSAQLRPLAQSINILGATQFNNKSVHDLVNALTRLGNSNLQSVQNVDFTRLGNSIVSLTSALSQAQTVSSNTISLVNALARLGSSGQYINQAIVGVPALGNAIRNLSASMANAPTVSVEAIELTSALGQLASVGDRAALTASNLGQLGTALVQLFTVLSTAPTVNTNIIEMVKNLAALASQGSKVGSASRGMASGFHSYSSAADRASKSTKSLAYAFGKFYANFWLLIRAFKGIGKMITYASDLTEVQNVVDTVFTDMSYKVEDFAKTSIQQFGMSELALKQYASRFQAMGSAMGITSEQVGNANAFLHTSIGEYVDLSDSISDVSLNLTKLTADMASFYNVDQADVAKDLESIYTGMTRPLISAA